MKKYLTEITLVLVAIIWALNFSVVKVALTQIDPMSFNALRYLLSALLLIGYTKWQGFSIAVKKEHVWPLLGIGLLGNLVYQLLFIIGINYTNASHAAVILGSIPVWVALFSHWFTNEKLSPLKMIGIFAAFLGIVLIIMGDHQPMDSPQNTTLGDVITLLSAISWAGYTILSKKYLNVYHATQYSGFMALVGVIALFLVGLPWLINVDFTLVSVAGYGGIVYSGLLSVGLAYLIWNRAIHKIGTVKTAAYQNLVPVLGLVFGVSILSEQLTVFQYIGACFTITGILLTRRN